MGQPDHIQSFDSLAALLISSDSEEDNDSLLKTPPRDEILRKAKAVLAKVDSRHSEASAAKTFVSVSSSASEASRRPSKIQTFHSRIQE